MALLPDTCGQPRGRLEPVDSEQTFVDDLRHMVEAQAGRGLFCTIVMTILDGRVTLCRVERTYTPTRKTMK